MAICFIVRIYTSNADATLVRHCLLYIIERGDVRHKAMRTAPVPSEENMRLAYGAT